MFLFTLGNASHLNDKTNRFNHGTYELSYLMTKQRNGMCAQRTPIILCIRPVWSESSLSAWRKLGSLATHWAHSEDSDQTGRMPGLIWIFAGRTLILLVLSCGSNFADNLKSRQVKKMIVNHNRNIALERSFKLTWGRRSNLFHMR